METANYGTLICYFRRKKAWCTGVAPLIFARIPNTTFYDTRTSLQTDEHKHKVFLQ